MPNLAGGATHLKYFLRRLNERGSKVAITIFKISLGSSAPRGLFGKAIKDTSQQGQGQVASHQGRGFSWKRKDADDSEVKRSTRKPSDEGGRSYNMTNTHDTCTCSFVTLQINSGLWIGLLSWPSNSFE